LVLACAGLTLAGTGGLAVAEAHVVGPAFETYEAMNSPVAGYGGWLVWSRAERWGPRPYIFRYRLVALHQGRLRVLSVRRRSVPFDVDVGPDARGRVVAVYSRCRTEPAPFGITDPSPHYRTGVDCRLYEYDLAAGRERRLVVPVPRHGSLFMPTIWRDRLAYAVSVSQSPHARKPVRLYVRVGERRPVRVPGGPRDGYYNEGAAAGPTGLDLWGDRLVYTWTYNARRVRCGYDGPNSKYGPTTNTVLVVERVAQRGGRHVLAHGGCPEDGNVDILSDPRLPAPGRITYVVFSRTGGPGFVRRLDLRSGTCREGRSREAINDYAEDGAGTSLTQTYVPEHTPAVHLTTAALDFSALAPKCPTPRSQPAPPSAG
jgi:hypothetical protein